MSFISCLDGRAKAMHLVCPHCQSPIEVVESPPPAEMACPSCGMSFRVEGGSTTFGQADPGEARTGAYQPTPSFRESEVATLPPRPVQADKALIVLPRVAGYEILNELGRGGMGVVYKA